MSILYKTRTFSTQCYEFSVPVPCPPGSEDPSPPPPPLPQDALPPPPLSGSKQIVILPPAGWQGGGCGSLVIGNYAHSRLGC